jgi:hypothetical protein
LAERRVEESVEMDEAISRDQALLWLNDRLGRRMLIGLSVGCGEFSRSVVSAAGELRHWSATRSSDLSAAAGAALREVFAEGYAVGVADFDISDPLLRCEFAIRQAPHAKPAKLAGAAELVLRLGDTEVTITPASDDAHSGVPD